MQMCVYFPALPRPPFADATALNAPITVSHSFLAPDPVTRSMSPPAPTWYQKKALGDIRLAVVGDGRNGATNYRRTWQWGPRRGGGGGYTSALLPGLTMYSIHPPIS